MDFKILRLKELAKSIKVSESTVRTWKRRGDIPENCFLKIGATVFVKIDQFREFTELGGKIK